MRWNVDFELTSIVFQLIFIFFFIVRKHLPTRRNRYYISCVGISVATAALDVITAYMNSYPQYFSMPLIDVTNMIYFSLIPMLALFFFIYILTITNQYSFTRSPLFAALCTPALVGLLLGISSPFTDFLYFFDGTLLYHQGNCYMVDIVANAFYIVLAMSFVSVYRKEVDDIERFSIYFFCTAMVVGIAIQGLFFRWVLLSNAMTAMALIIIYLSLQNPDMFIDKETGMFNQLAFDVLSNECFSIGKSFSCVQIKINDYRTLNTLYGTENVEKTMSGVVSYLNTVFAKKRLFRFDAYTFMIQEPVEGDFETIERVLRNRFSKPFTGITSDIQFSVSIIILPYWNMPGSLSGINTVLEFVERSTPDIATGITVEVDEKVNERMEREAAVERAIDNAVNNNAIQIYYQPIYSTVTGEISSCEALARLFDDDIGFIPPDEFIPRAEESGSIVPLGEQIFIKVCQFLKEQEPWNYGLESVHVNLSPVQCMKDDLADKLISITDEMGIARTHIDLEITETAAVEQDKVILKNMDRLIDASFSFSLDDYGTGYSNTATITQLPFANVKIDKSLLWSYFNGKKSILPDLVTMFHNQNLKLIVEGVETWDMVDTLTKMKCQFLQGYYFSKPLPPREFVNYVRNYNKK